MTQLNCSVRNCNYNEDALCCRDQIKVEGSSATASNETCCGSFAESEQGLQATGCRSQIRQQK